MTSKIARHLSTTLFTGILAAVPLGITAFVVVVVEARTREPARDLLGLDIPFIGIALAVVLIYLLGFLVSSLVGKFLLRQLDRVLSRMPVLREVYRAWKQVLVVPGGSTGMYAHVVLVPDEDDARMALGFTSGEPVAGDPDHWCVFLPEIPNPLTGTLHLVRRDRCIRLDISTEEAFKMMLSGGNFIPEGVGVATANLRAPGYSISGAR